MFKFSRNEERKEVMEKRRRTFETELEPRKRLADISVIGLAVIFVAMVLSLLSISSNNNILNKINIKNSELARALTYERVLPGEENIAGTNDVKFNAYFLYDLEQDNILDKVKGSCAKIGEQDTLYMSLDVLGDGELQDGKIEIVGTNFYLFANTPKDRFLVSNVIGDNVREIKFNTIEHGNSKTINSFVRSGIYTSESSKNNALQNNSNNYSRDDNKIIFTGTYVDSNGVRTQVRKEVMLTVDWYGEIETKIDNIYQVRGNTDRIIDDTNQEVTLNFEILTKETKNQLLLLNNTVVANIPLLNGYEPLEVSVTSSNLIYSYDRDTRQLTITRDSVSDEQGNITSGISTSNNYRISVKYPKEAYELFGGKEFEIKIPVEEFYFGYNNDKDGFENPLKSNVAQDTVRVIFDHVENYEDTAELILGKYKRVPYFDYVISKLKPMRIYNGTSNYEVDDNYEVRWIYHRGSIADSSKAILKETENGVEQKQDEFLTMYNDSIAMGDFTSNIGIYFNNLEYILSDNGQINVYDDELGNLLLTIDKDNISKYTEENPFYYNVAIKHVRVEATGINPQRTLEIVNIKQIDDRYLTFNYSQESFKEVEKIQSNLAVYKGDSLISNTSNYALYELPKSNAEISISDSTIGTEAIKTNEVITINAKYEPKNDDIGWVNGTFAVKLPQEIINANIKSVEVVNDEAQVKSYEYVENSFGKFLKVYIKNDEPKALEIKITLDLAANPRVDSLDTSLELYAYNDEGVSYYFPVIDEMDINNDGNYDQEINHTSTPIHIVSPNSMLANQTISNFSNPSTTVVSPNVADVVVAKNGSQEKTAKITAQIANNYEGSITDVVLLGKIPFEGNKSIVSGEDLGSTFTTKMKSPGITIESNVAATVYYSTNENPSRVVDEASNGWTLAENVPDWSNIKSYLIDLGSKTVNRGESYNFSYTISIPNGLNYNQYAYGTFTTYYALNTPQGKYRTQSSSTPIGIRITDKYELTVKKYHKGRTKVVPEAIYSVTEVKNVGGVESYGSATVVYTNALGDAIFNNLNVDKVYEIREIISPADYELNNNAVRIYGSINQSGNLEITKLSGTTKGNIEVSNTFGDHSVYVSLEDETKARLIITKQDKETGAPVFGAKFQITGDSLNRAYTTNAYGEIYVSGLKLDEEYTLTEVDVEGYYLSDPIKIEIVKTTSSYSIIQVGNISDDVTKLNMTIENSIPTGNITIADKKIPTFNLRLNKIIEGAGTNLSGVKFRLYKGSETVGDYTTDSSGKVDIYGLYQEEDEEGVDQTYTLSEIQTLEGFTKASDIKFKVKTVYEGGNPTLKLYEIDPNADNLHTYSVDNDENQITLNIENSPLFRLVKKDSETGERLQGAKFAIYDLTTNEPAKNSRGQIVGNKEIVNDTEYYLVTTDANGEIIPDLPEGLYRATEIMASDEKYDIENKEYYFKVGDMQDSSLEHTYIDYDGELVITNDRQLLNITTSIVEIDGEKNGTISGDGLPAYEQVKYGESNEDSIIMTPDAGCEIIDVKVNGEEWLFEPQADGTYVMPQFTNMTEDKHIEVTFCKSANKITIIKEDKVTLEKIKGAKFSLDKIVNEQDPNPYHAEIESNSLGKAVTQLPFGTYSLTEIEAPKGYKKIQNPQEIDFSENSIHEFTSQDEETAKVRVHHLIKGTDIKVAEDELIEGNEGEDYFTSPILDLPEYELETDEEGEYVLPNNSSGQFTTDVQDVYYYYVSRHITLTVHHFIEGTATRVPLRDGNPAPDEISTGEENAEYQTSPIQDILLSDVYELADTPINASGTYQKPGVEVIYTYKKVVREVEISKIDKNKPTGNNFIPGVKFEIYKYDNNVQGNFVSEVTTDTFGKAKTRLEAGKYIAIETFAPDGYIPIDGDNTITVTKAEDRVSLTVENEKGTGDVIVHHYIEKIDGTKTTDKVILANGEIAEDETLTGQIDTIYLTEAKVNLPDRYKLSIIPDNASGIYGYDTTEVTYYYKEQPGKVIVHHFLEGTTKPVQLISGEMTEDIEINGVVGDDYSTAVANIANKYDIVSIPDNANGKFVPGEIDVTYLYKLKDTSVRVRHLIQGTEDKVPQTGGGVVEDVIIEGRVDDEYEALEAQDKVEYYEVAEEPSNKTGLMELDQIVVTYYYKLKKYPYTVNYIDENSLDAAAPAKLSDEVTWGTTINAADEVIDIVGHNFERPEKESITISQNDNTLNLYYSKITGLSYTVNYIDKDEQTSIKDAKPVGNKTYADKVQASSEIIDIPGYNYDSVDKEVLDIGMGENVLNIYYTKRNDLSYTVNYIEKGKTNSIKNSKTVSNKTLKEVIDTSIEIIDIDGFTYDSIDKDSLTIEAEGNEINIYYERRTDLSYKINYIEEGNPEPIKAQSIVGNQAFDSEIVVSELNKEVDGFNFLRSDKNTLTIGTGENVLNFYYQRRTDLSYTVRYLDKDDSSIEIHLPTTVGNMTYGDVIQSAYEVITIKGYDYDSPDKDFLEITTSAEQNIINLYYTKRSGLGYMVNYLGEDGNPIFPSKTSSNKAFGDIINASDEIIDIYGYEYDYPNPAILHITDDDDQNIINLYYSRIKGKVIAHYYEENTTTEVAPAIEYTGYVNDAYTTAESTLIPAKYELVSQPFNKNGVYKEGTIDVNYYYKKRPSLVLVHHMEDPAQNGGKYVKLADDEELYFPIDSTYTTSPSSNVPIKYEVVPGKIPSNGTGTMTVDPIEVTYYYQLKTSSVVVQYLDRYNNEEIKTQDTLTGKVDSPYHVAEAYIDGYVSVNDEPLVEGTFDVDTTIIKFLYAKKINITLRHIDDVTLETFLTETNTSYKQGDNYTINGKNFDNYVISGLPSNYTGTIGHNDFSLDYYYTHVTGGVIEKHVDYISGEVLFNQVHTGNYGDEYHTSSRTFDGYDLIETMLPTNSDGLMLDGVTTVTYYYVKRATITVKYVDKYQDFELLNGDGSSTRVVITGHEGDNYTTEAKTFDGYDLDGMPANASGRMPGGSTTITYLYKQRSGGLVINHINLLGNVPIVPEEVRPGYVGQDYVVELMPANVYELIDSEGEREGKFTKATKYITLYYQQKAQVIVRYIDIDTGEDIKNPDGSSSKITINKYVGDEYTSDVKYFDGYLIVEEANNKSGTMTVDPITVTYKYRKLRFNLKLEGSIKKLTVNGVAQPTSANIAKVEFKKNEAKSQRMQIHYNLRLTNDSEITASGILRDRIPGGMIMDPALNPEWNVSGNLATIETGELEPGEVRDYEIILTWNPSADNMGVKSNSVEVVATNNVYGFEQITKSDDLFQAELIVAISTGDSRYNAIASMLLIVMIGIMVAYFRVGNIQERKW